MLTENQKGAHNGKINITSTYMVNMWISSSFVMDFVEKVPTTHPPLHPTLHPNLSAVGLYWQMFVTLMFNLMM